MTASVDQWQAAVDAEKPKRGRKVRVADASDWRECECGGWLRIVRPDSGEVECPCGRVWPLGGG